MSDTANAENIDFHIEDQLHPEIEGPFASIEAVLAELRRLAAIPWEETPNRAPCTSWHECGREYYIRESDKTSTPWQMLRRVHALDISAAEVRWVDGLEQQLKAAL